MAICFRIAKDDEVRSGALVFVQVLAASLLVGYPALVGVLRWDVAWITGR